MRLRSASILAAGLLAVLATVTFAATPAAAFHGHSRGPYYGNHTGQPLYGPHYAYGYGPAYYPPAYPPVYAAPPPVIAAPVLAAPVVAGPLLPTPVPTALPTALPLPAAAYPATPVAPGIEGTPGCLVVREYTTEIEVGGETVEGYGHACLQADGSWKRGAPAPVR